MAVEARNYKPQSGQGTQITSLLEVWILASGDVSPALLPGHRHWLAHCLWPFLTCHSLNRLPNCSAQHQSPGASLMHHLSHYHSESTSFPAPATIWAARLILALVPALVCAFSLPLGCNSQPPAHANLLFPPLLVPE